MKNTPKIKRLLIEIFIDSSRKNRQMIKWFLVEPLLRVLSRTIYMGLFEEPYEEGSTQNPPQIILPSTKKGSPRGQTEEPCMVLLSTFLTECRGDREGKRDGQTERDRKRERERDYNAKGGHRLVTQVLLIEEKLKVSESSQNILLGHSPSKTLNQFSAESNITQTP